MFSGTTIYWQGFVSITIEAVYAKGETITQKQKAQDSSIHRHYQHHWGDMEDGVEAIVKKVENVLL